MSRVYLPAMLVAAAIFGASDAEAAKPVLHSQELTVCKPVETFVAPYSEQVCYTEPAGYTVCRWFKRQHVVTAPADCVEPSLGGENNRALYRKG